MMKHNMTEPGSYICTCGSDIRHNMQYDSCYCTESFEWTEDECDDEECEFCSKRPENARTSLHRVDISAESLHFLTKLVKEIKNQDNRATSKPYFYCIKDHRIQSVPEGCGDEFRYIWDNEVFTKSECLEYLDLDEEAFLKLLDMGDIQLYEVVEEVYEPNNHNVFFTEKACHEHIEQNRHHFNKPYSYVHAAWRNPEIEGIFRAIEEIVKNDEEESG